MKFAIILALLASQAFANSYALYSDIGFRGAGHFISVELTSVDGEEALRFRLSSVATPGKSAALSPCAYKQKTLEHEVRNIADAKVKSDFSWIFFRSNHSSTSLEQFYPEFKSLLERSDASCPVQDLQKLKDQLETRKG